MHRGKAQEEGEKALAINRLAGAATALVSEARIAIMDSLNKGGEDKRSKSKDPLQGKKAFED